MRSQGALTLFQRSVVKHKLRYTSLIADGDSKMHSLLLENKPYGDVIVDKMDCIDNECMKAAILNTKCLVKQ